MLRSLRCECTVGMFKAPLPSRLSTFLFCRNLRRHFHSPLLGREIVVTDHLHLWEGALWVNDRGCGTDGTYLYGNTRDVPYKMDRVRWSSHRGEPVWEDRRAS